MKRKSAPILVLLAALVLGVSACNSKPTSAQAFATGTLAKLEVPKAAPAPLADKFQDPAGAEKTLADYKGKVLVVNFWGTFCGPCKEEMPTLAALADKYKGKDVIVMPISFDKLDDRDLAQASLARFSGGKLNLYQADSYDMAFDAGTQTFPTTIIYGRDGGEIARLVGPAKWDSPEARGLVDFALEKK